MYVIVLMDTISRFTSSANTHISNCILSVHTGVLLCNIHLTSYVYMYYYEVSLKWDQIKEALAHTFLGFKTGPNTIPILFIIALVSSLVIFTYTSTFIVVK